MEVIPKDPYLKFHPDTLQAVREEFNLHQPGAMEEVIRSFEEWIEKQSHFTKKDFTKHFLEASIIMSKGSLEKAKKTLDKLCTLKTLIPKYFSKHDVKNEFYDLPNFMFPVPLPTQTNDNYRVILQKVISTDNMSAAILHDCYKLDILISEYMKAHDYTQGIIVVVDARDVNILTFAMKINIIDLKHFMTVLIEGYGMRVKGIHILSDSKAVDALVTIVKQVVSPKVGERVYVHKTIDSLYDIIPKDIMPEEYGGREKPALAIYRDMVELFSIKENVEYFKDICQRGTDEAYRQTAQFNNDILGMPGSFRSLQVD